ncbi:Alpha/beta hydrolase family protein [compost metagenome]
MAMDAIFADQRWSAYLDENRVALIGHSMGGYTSLALAGGIPHTKHQIQYDPDHKITSSQEVPVKADERIKALVLMAPATGWFLSEGALSAVKIPILILTGEFDDITPAFHAEIVMRGVPDGKQVTYHEEKNASHYSFLGVFPESVRKTNFPPAMDRPGFDRAKFHEELNVEIAEFLAKYLL